MVEEVRHYYENSTLHIIRYISDKTKSVLERIVWTIVLVTAVSGIINYLNEDWTMLRSGPLRVNVDDAGLNVGTVDFPSLTICPANVIHPTKLDQLVTSVLGTSASKDMVERFTVSFRALALVSFPNWRHGYDYLSSANITPYPIHNDDIIPFFKSLMTPIDDIFMGCFWRGTQFPCSEVLRTQSTEHGLCYSFNSFSGIRNYDETNKVSSTQISQLNQPPCTCSCNYSYNFYMTQLIWQKLGKGKGLGKKGDYYKQLDYFINKQQKSRSPSDDRSRQSPPSPRNPPFVNDDENIEVLRTNSEGRTNGVELFLYDNKNNSEGEIRYYSIVTKPYLYPSTLLMSPLLPRLKSVYHTEVQVNVFSADESLNHLTPQALPCTLDSTVPYDNCLLKCRQSLILEQCRCVLYTHALLLSLEDIKVCGPQHLKCISDLHKSLNQIQTSRRRQSNVVKCNCKPECAGIKYLTRTEALPREADTYVIDYAIYIEVFYFSKWAIGYVLRSKLSLEDLIVNLGGTSGLYLGASFISVVEILVTIIKLIFFYLKRTKH